MPLLPSVLTLVSALEPASLPFCSGKLPERFQEHIDQKCVSHLALLTLILLAAPFTVALALALTLVLPRRHAGLLILLRFLLLAPVNLGLHVHLDPLPQLVVRDQFFQTAHFRLARLAHEIVFEEIRLDALFAERCRAARRLDGVPDQFLAYRTRELGIVGLCLSDFGRSHGARFRPDHLLPLPPDLFVSAEIKCLYETATTHLSGMACTKPPSAVNMAPADDPSLPGVSTVFNMLRGIPVTRTNRFLSCCCGSSLFGQSWIQCPDQCQRSTETRPWSQILCFTQLTFLATSVTDVSLRRLLVERHVVIEFGLGRSGSFVSSSYSGRCARLPLTVRYRSPCSGVTDVTHIDMSSCICSH